MENALKHGLLHKEGVKKLEIKFEVTDVLICTIIDNGVGRDKAREIKARQKGNHKSFSTKAIKTRFDILQEHYKTSLGVEYQDLFEGNISVGTKVVLRIPVKRKY